MHMGAQWGKLKPFLFFFKQSIHVVVNMLRFLCILHGLFLHGDTDLTYYL